MSDAEMTSNKPYLLRAFYEWIVDNELTPYILIDTSFENVVVPEQYIIDGKLTLNIAPRAITGLEMGNSFVVFGARFNGAPMQLEFPVESVLAIYARENEQGMVFPKMEDDAKDFSGEDDDQVESEAEKVQPIMPQKKRPTLTIVK